MRPGRVPRPGLLRRNGSIIRPTPPRASIHAFDRVRAPRPDLNENCVDSGDGRNSIRRGPFPAIIHSTGNHLMCAARHRNHGVRLIELLIVIAIIAASDHTGGSNTLMADSSVRFIKDPITLNTWWSRGTRANGEVVVA